MNIWKLTAAGNLVLKEEEPVFEGKKQKIRITKVLLTESDADICRGLRRVEYPRVPGRYALGVIVEGDGALPKGTRVLLHASLPEENTGTQKKNFAECAPRVCGTDVDGYLRDFVYASDENFTPLPDAVGDGKALLVHHLALAKAAVETLSPAKGDHIAVIGADHIGLLTCLLLIYQQVAPILIDLRQDRLDFAKKLGIYYAYPADEKLMDGVGGITGGRLCDGAVFVAGAGMDEHDPFSVLACDTNVVFCGTDHGNVNLKLDEIFTKQLSVHGVSDGTDYLEAAINLIAQKAVDLSAFTTSLTPSANLKQALDDVISGRRGIGKLNVVNMM